VPHRKLSKIEDVIEDARNGRMFILIDDEDRENEGDLVVPAQMATPEAINFMATHGRGLICLSMTAERIQELGLNMMTDNNKERLETAFTVSIEAAEGVTTGISAHDRAHTISVAIGHNRGADDIVSPGHVFPLQARDGGVLVRAGHTEAAVDVARLAGLQPAGVICEIMNDDGTMARLPDLVKFADKHELKIATIADLIRYRRHNDNLVECIAESDFHSSFGGDWQMKIYANTVEYSEHVALVKGDVASGEPVPVRMHSLNIFSDLVGDLASTPDQARTAMEMIGDMGRGVVVLLPNMKANSLSQVVQHRSETTERPSFDLKSYGIGAQILRDLGVRDMILLSNTEHHIIGLEGYGLSVVDQKPLKREQSDG
jgi:3,4-dihydroxy 2-butanone 4-phosphate synthase/GTP cyclohydrolase II